MNGSGEGRGGRGNHDGVIRETSREPEQHHRTENKFQGRSPQAVVNTVSLGLQPANLASLCSTGVRAAERAGRAH